MWELIIIYLKEKPTKEELEKCIDNLYTSKEIANIYNISTGTVSVLFKKYGLKSKNIGGSRNVKDLVGMKFGRLKVLSFSKVGDHGKEYNCVCECLTEKVIRGSLLTSGAVVSCGCLKNEKAKHNAKNLHSFKNKNIYLEKALTKINEKYNMLTIIGVKNYNNNNNYMLCKCDCGNETLQIYADLKSGKVKSCGCHQKEIASLTGSKVGMNNYKNKYNWYFIKDGEVIECRSGYEVIYANYLIKNNINFLYEPITFKLGNGKRYTPDFYIRDTDEYIEIKGSFKLNPKYNHQYENIKIFSINNKITIMYWEDIVSICGLSYKSYSTYFRKSNKLSISIEDYLANKRYD